MTGPSLGVGGSDDSRCLQRVKGRQGPSMRVLGAELTSGSASRCSSGHPCVCGERYRACCDLQCLVEVIPACAGSGSPTTYGVPPPPGHPYVCGERSEHGERQRPPTGSSLRVWGVDWSTLVIHEASSSKSFSPTVVCIPTREQPPTGL